jgi:hypothetical protein
MRTLLAFAIFAGGICAIDAPSDAAPKYKRGAKHSHSAPRYSRKAVECERARHADPTGLYRSYPCWAQEALSPKGGGPNRR